MTWWEHPIAIIPCPWKHDENTQIEIIDCSLGGTYRTSIKIIIATGSERRGFEDDEETPRDNHSSIELTLPGLLQLQDAIDKAIKIYRERNNE